MYKGLSAPFIHRPIATTLIMVAVFLVGLVAFPSSAGRAPAAGRLSDHHRLGFAAGRFPGHDGDLGRAAARTADRANSGRLADDVDEFARRDGDHRPVRSQPQHRRRRQRHPGRDQRRRRATAKGSAQPADLSQGQPLRHAHPHPVRSVGRRADHRRRRRRREYPRPAPQSDLGRLPRTRRRPADAGHPHPDRSSKARRKGAAARGRARADRHCDCRQPQGRAHRSEADLHHPRQRPADPGQGLERRHHRLSQWRAGARARHRPGGRGTAELDPGGLEQWQAERLSRRVQDSRRERHQHGRGDQGHAGDPAGFDPADHSCQHSLRPHHDHSRFRP